MKTNKFLPLFLDIAGKPLPHNQQTLDESQLCAEDLIILRRLGFEQQRPDAAEPSYSEHRLRLGNSKLLHNVDVTIAGNFIDVWAEEHARGVAPGQKVIVHARPFTWNELAALLQALNE